MPNRKVPENYEVVFPGRPSGASFSDLWETLWTGGQGGGWHTSDRIYEANTTSLEHAPRGKLFFLGGHHCLPMLPSLQLYTYRFEHLTGSKNIFWSVTIFKFFVSIIYIYIFSIKLSIFGMIPRPLNFIRKIKIFPWVFFFFDYFIDNLILEMRKGVN